MLWWAPPFGASLTPDGVPTSTRGRSAGVSPGSAGACCRDQRAQCPPAPAAPHPSTLQAEHCGRSLGGRWRCRQRPRLPRRRVLTDLWGWRAIYWINLPIDIALVVVITATVPVPPPDKNRRSLDLAGASLLVVAIMAVVVGTSMVERVDLRLLAVSAVAVGVLVAAAFLVQQRRAAEPLVPRHALTTPSLRAGIVVSFVNTATTSSAGVLVALHLTAGFEDEELTVWEVDLSPIPR